MLSLDVTLHDSLGLSLLKTFKQSMDRTVIRLENSDLE